MAFPGSVLLSPEDVLKISASKNGIPIGTRGYTRDGRVFRWSQNGAAALKPGLPVQSAAPLAPQKLLTSGTTEIRANSTLIKVVHNTTELFTSANAFADGYLYAATSSTSKGAGQYIQIKSHTAVGTTATAVVISPYPGDCFYAGTTNFGTTAIKLSAMRNPYSKVVVKPSGIVTAPVVGVPVRPITASYYFWIQTWGACPVRCSATALVIGHPAGVSTGDSARFIGINSTKPTSGAASATWTVVNYLIAGLGVNMHVGVSGEYSMIFLKIAP